MDATTRKDLPTRSAYRATLAISIALGLGILILVNFIGSRRYARFDWTTAGRYSLSEKTVNVLRELKSPVQVTVFMTAGTPLYPEVDELLKRYKAKSAMLTVETLDPTRNPVRAKTFVEETGLRNLAVVFRAGDKKKIVTEDRIVEYDYSRARMGGEPSVKSFRGEQEFTSAILSVTQAKAPKVVFTSGHGERKFDAARTREGFSEVAESLKADNCTVEEWATLGAAAVPEGADLVVVAGPRTPFTEPERDLLKKYLDAGGRVVFFLDVEFPPGASNTLSDFGLGPLLASLGLTLDSDVVVDPKNTLPMMGAETVFAKSFRSHPVTKLLAGMPVVFPLARSVSVPQTPVPGWRATPLVETSPDGWGETNLKDLQKTGLPKKDDKDVKGPVCLAAAVEADDGSKTVPGDATKPAETPKKKARVVAFGDADWASNAGIANAANRLLLSSAVNWALERESLVAIPPKSADQVAVTLTRRDMGQVAFVVLLLLPLAAVAMGVAIWVRRRK
ncbi:MAG TPA: GldG family protein [Thermoanaerobaculia bacterium]|nr:GldG family protein [Thermoanaerobaculia bacterium]